MKRFSFYLFLTFGLLTGCSKSLEQSDTTKQVEADSVVRTRITQAIENTLSDNDFMGTIVVKRAGNELFAKSFGYTDIAAKQVTNLDTLYPIGSVSKTYTAVLVLKAVEEGKLSLEQEIQEFFPTLENATNIRIKHLLQHRSGIPSYTKDPVFRLAHTEARSQTQLLDMILSYDSESAPDSKASYSNSNYFLLASILEQVYKQSFPSLLNEKITSPLGLNNTYHASTFDYAPHTTLSYSYQDSWALMPQSHMSWTFGAGDIIASASDLASFFDGLFNGKIISAEHLEMMQTVKGGFGSGLMQFDMVGRVSYGHGGALDGYRAKAIYFPEQALNIVITANGVNDNLEELNLALTKAYFNDTKIPITAEEVARYAGTFASTTDDHIVKFIQEGDKLVHVIMDEFKEILTYKDNRQFLFEQASGPSILFTFSEDGNEMLFEQGKFTGNYQRIALNDGDASTK